MSDILRARQAVDTVLTQLSYSAYQSVSLIPFVAPTVVVPTRSGRIITFGREQFAVRSTKRDPYANHKTMKVSGFSSKNAYILEQHSQKAEVSWEEIREAENGAVNMDLKELAVMDAVAAIEQSLEQELYSLITRPGNYEAGLSVTVAAADQFSNAGSDPEATVINLKSEVRRAIGKYPTRAIISDDVYRSLILHPIFRDKQKYTTTQSSDLTDLANWFGLPGGIEVADRLKEDPATGELVDMFPGGTMLMFVDARDTRSSRGAQGDEKANNLYIPTPGIVQSTATFAQLYSLPEGLTVGQERINEDNDTVSNTVRFTGSIVLPSVGSTNRSAAGILLSGLV